MNSPSVTLRFRDVSFALWGREREQFQLIGLLIEPEFKAANVAAIHHVGTWLGLGMRDGGPTRGTVPRHRIRQYRAYEPWLPGGLVQEFVQAGLRVR